MARWTAREIAAIPTVSDGGPDDPTWYPLQHALGIDTFGANLFVATHADQTLVEEHDERTSGQWGWWHSRGRSHRAAAA